LSEFDFLKPLNFLTFLQKKCNDQLVDATLIEERTWNLIGKEEAGGSKTQINLVEIFLFD
jgi:hypothetical protein